MTVCSVKGVTHNDDPTENYNLTMQLLSVPLHSTESFNIFQLAACNFVNKQLEVLVV